MAQGKGVWQLFWGEEDFLIDEAVLAQREAVSDYSEWSLTHQKDLSATVAYVTRWASPSLFPHAGLLRIRADAFFAKPCSKAAASQLLAALALVQPPSVLVMTAGRVHQKNALLQWFSAHGTVRSFPPISPWRLPAWTKWIQERGCRLGKRITGQGAMTLHSLAGGNLRVLAGELEKLACYVGEQEEITEDDVRQLASPGAVYIFALMDAVRKRAPREALAALAGLRRQGEGTLPLLHFLLSQLRPLYQMKIALAAGASPASLKQTMRLHPFVFQKNIEAASRFSLATLAQFWQQAAVLDVALKTRVVHPAWLENMVLTLCSDASPS